MKYIARFKEDNGLFAVFSMNENGTVAVQTNAEFINLNCKGVEYDGCINITPTQLMQAFDKIREECELYKDKEARMKKGSVVKKDMPIASKPNKAIKEKKVVTKKKTVTPTEAKKKASKPSESKKPKARKKK